MTPGTSLKLIHPYSLQNGSRRNLVVNCPIIQVCGPKNIQIDDQLRHRKSKSKLLAQATLLQPDIGVSLRNKELAYCHTNEQHAFTVAAGRGVQDVISRLLGATT